MFRFCSDVPRFQHNLLRLRCKRSNMDYPVAKYNVKTSDRRSDVYITSYVKHFERVFNCLCAGSLALSSSYVLENVQPMSASNTVLV